jgi:hypothetical protein
MVHLHELV